MTQLTQLRECFVGETLEIGLVDLQDTTGAFVTALGGGESLTYTVTSEQAGSIDSGSLTYKTNTDGTWHAFTDAPSTKQRIKVKITGTIDNAVRKFLHEVQVKDF